MRLNLLLLLQNAKHNPRDLVAVGGSCCLRRLPRLTWKKGKDQDRDTRIYNVSVLPVFVI